MKSKASLFLCILTMISIYTSIFANASYLDPHAYIMEYVDGNGTGVYGGYFETSYGQEYLYSNWSYWNYKSFITNEMWIDFVAGHQWIELGDVDGSVNGSYWNGHYLAFQYFDLDQGYVYKEYTIGSAGPTGKHRYELQHIGNDVWRAYIDGSTVATITWDSPFSNYQSIGMETNDSKSTFVSNIYDTYMQYKGVDNLWHHWGFGEPYNLDSNNLGWSSFFSWTNHRVTFLN